MKVKRNQNVKIGRKGSRLCTVIVIPSAALQKKKLGFLGIRRGQTFEKR